MSNERCYLCGNTEALKEHSKTYICSGCEELVAVEKPENETARVYIASPFFTHQQNEDVAYMERVLSGLGLSYYSPRKASNISDGVSPEKALAMNISEIDETTFMIANVDYGNRALLPSGQTVRVSDIGTSIEMGIAWAKGKKVLLWSAESPKKQNLMETMFFGSCYGKQLHEGIKMLLRGIPPSQELFETTTAEKVMLE